MSIEEYADRLYTQAITDPEVNSLDTNEMARYIREEADALCLDWREVLSATGSLHPTTVEFVTAKEYRNA
jgi:hypothetical protein